MLRGHHLWVSDAAFSPDDTRVVTASGDGMVRVWPAGGVGQPVVLSSADTTASLGSLERAVERVAFHPDGRSLVAAGGDGAARIWRLGGSGEPRVVRGSARSMRRAFFNRDGSRLLTSGAEGKTYIWSADGSGSPIVLPGEGTAFSPDGSSVVTGNVDGSARVWRVDGTLVAELPAPAPDARALGGSAFVDARFSPDGRFVVVASGPVARIWGIGDLSEPVMLRGHERKLSGATFSRWPTRLRPATMGRLGSGPRRQRRTARLRGHKGRGWRPRSIAMAKRRHRAEDKTARIWRVHVPGSPDAEGAHGSSWRCFAATEPSDEPAAALGRRASGIGVSRHTCALPDRDRSLCTVDPEEAGL